MSETILQAGDHKELQRMLEGFAEAWNRHDVAGLMACMHEECIFETAAGPEQFGSRHVGYAAVERAFAATFVQFPDAQWRSARHFVAAERGVSEWTFTATAADGTRIEANGVDLFTFREGKILVKNVFRKDRPRLPAA
jgi:ketosteroid isomerase-like protein